jgi:hypothetical protein
VNMKLEAENLSLSTDLDKIQVDCASVKTDLEQMKIEWDISDKNKTKLKKSLNSVNRNVSERDSEILFLNPI